MRLIVLSDTHHDLKNLRALLPVINAADYVAHLGDYADDILTLKTAITAQILAVRGNCDLINRAPRHEFLTVGRDKLLFTHGDYFGVKNRSLLTLAAFAKENGCSFAFYGHTHVTDTSMIGGVTLVNPGSLSTPRTGRPAYCIVTGGADGIKTEIVCLP
jgi:putative phosphoesterase